MASENNGKASAKARRMARWLWGRRRELALPAAAGVAWVTGVSVTGAAAGTATAGAVAATVAAVPATRRALAGWVVRGRLRRRLAAGMAATRVHALAGRLPRVARVRAVPVGVRVSLRLRPGQSADMLEARGPELAAACRAQVVRVVRDRAGGAHRVDLDVVLRDPLLAVGTVAWADRHADVLSMFDPVHLGTGEDGRPVRMSLVERSLLVAGLPGAGKSSLLQPVVAHAALSPDALLVLVDPKQVELAPWRHRAWRYAGPDIADALDVAADVHAEMERRLAELQRMPGVVRKVTRDTGIPLLVFVVDELAYHMSVAGSGQQRAAWTALVRDIVARGRAAGIIPVVATQRPTNEVVPASVSGLFALRACGRVASTGDSDRVLGEGTARQGWDASTIPLDARGVLVLTSETAVTPQRIKGAWLDDEAVADLSITTVRHRPTPPGGAAKDDTYANA